MSIPNILFEAPKVHVFSLPPSDFLKSAAWEGSYIWSGKLKFVRENSKFFVRLFEKGDSNELFGECPIREHNKDGSSSSDSESVQPATDSTRAFVLRVEDGDQFSYVGLMFDDRTVAYNFSSSLIHRKKGLGPAPVLPVQDRSLDQGEEITIDLFNKVKLGKADGGEQGSTPLLSSPVPSASHLLQSGPGELPRVALDRLPVSTSGKSRRIKIEEGASPTDVAVVAAATDASSAETGKKSDDIFAAPAPTSSSNATAAPRGGATSIDDVFGGAPAAVPAPQAKAQKDVLDTLFG